MTVEIICADARDALAAMPEGSVHACITSPPYWGLRDYRLKPVVWGDAECEHEWAQESYQRRSNDGGDPDRKQETNAGAVGRDEPVHHAFCRRCSAWRGSLGLEPTPELYVEHIVQVMREVRRVLRDDGTLWLNLGDCYASGNRGSNTGHSEAVGAPAGAHGHYDRQANRNLDPAVGLKPKDLCGMPWRVAFALQADGWWLREEIIWYKKNPMPESVNDRCTRSHEQLFRLSKSARYYADQDAIRESAIHEGRIVKATGNGAKNMGSPNRTAIGFTDHDTIVAGRNRRSVWEIATQPFGLEMCASCKTIYSPAQYRRLRGGSNPRCNHEVVEGEPCGGTNWLAQDGGALCLSCETFYTAKQLGSLPRAARCRRCGSEEWLSHFAVFPEKLVEPCVLAGCPEGGTVLDPFAGSGTVGLVAERLGRHSVLIDASEDYCRMARERTAQRGLMAEAAS